jgi:hypothetical protein
MSFTDFLLSRRVGDNPRGDFIEDTRMLIEGGRFPAFTSIEALEGWLMLNGACDEAIREGCRLWRQYQKACR